MATLTVISTPRLRLEPLTLSAARMLVAGYVPRVPPPVPDYPTETSLLAASLLVRADQQGEDHGPFTSYQVVRRTDGRVIGDGGFMGAPDPDGTVFVGVELAPSARGCGYATEALTALLGWAHEQHDVRAVRGDCSRANVASQRVMERAGMRCVSETGELLLFES